MTDIYDIKNLVLGSPIDFFNTTIFFIFLVILYFLVFNFSKKQKKSVKKQNIPEKNIKKNIDFEKILDEFEKKYLNLDYLKFYNKLAYITKEIIKYKQNKDISKMTFEELQNIKISENIKNLIKQIYFKQYAKNIEDNKNLRKNLILEVRKII